MITLPHLIRDFWPLAMVLAIYGITLLIDRYGEDKPDKPEEKAKFSWIKYLCDASWDNGVLKFTMVCVLIVTMLGVTMLLQEASREGELVERRRRTDIEDEEEDGENSELVLLQGVLAH